MLCFRKFLKAKKFMEKKEGKVSIISFENVVSHSAKNCRRGTLQSFITFGFRNKMDERVGRGECHDLPSKVSCLPVPENFVG